jgi:hypothetical protein
VLAYQKGLKSGLAQTEWLPLINSECFFMKNDSQILTYTKNVDKWEFMILDMDSTKIGSFGIDPQLNSMTVVDNGGQTLSTYDMRKFTKLSEYKVSSNKVSQIKLSESGLISIVSDGKVIVCKVVDEQLQTLIEFSPKEAIK